MVQKNEQDFGQNLQAYEDHLFFYNSPRLCVIVPVYMYMNRLIGSHMMECTVNSIISYRFFF